MAQQQLALLRTSKKVPRAAAHPSGFILRQVEVELPLWAIGPVLIMDAGASSAESWTSVSLRWKIRTVVWNGTTLRTSPEKGGTL